MTEQPLSQPPMPEETGPSDAELEAARNDIERLSQNPGELIALTEYIKGLEEEIKQLKLGTAQDADDEDSEFIIKYGRKDGLGESGGVVWATIRTKNGTDVCVTARNVYAQKAFEEMYDTALHVMEKMDGELLGKQQTHTQPASIPPPPAAPPTSTPPVPEAPAETPVPEGQGEIDVFEVEFVSHQITTKGVHVLNVKGGKWQKFGYTVWPEQIPERIKAVYEDWPVGKEYSAPPEMTFAWLDVDRKRFISFASDYSGE